MAKPMIRSKSLSFDRRRFLRGAGGVFLALPAFEAFAPRNAHAAGKVFSVFMCENNGAEPTQWFPKTLGPLTPEGMMGTAVEDLKDHAADILVIRGINWTHGNGVGCGHSSGCNTALTASKAVGSANRSLPTRESVDLRIGTLLKREPLNLFAGKKDSYLGDALAYAVDGKPRPADNSPWNVFNRMTGIDKAAILNPGAVAPMMPPPMTGPDKSQLRQKSLNDLLRVQIDALIKRPELSTEDIRRLNLHLSNVRDLEITMTKPMMASGGGGDLGGSLMRLMSNPAANELMEEAARTQLSLIALAFASDQTQIATLQVGGGNDHTRYMIKGVLAPPAHFVSHHVLSDGASGTAIPDAIELHHQIDMIHARMFKHLIEQLKAYKTADGRPLLDQTAAVWLNSLSNGPPHGTNNVPHVIAGTAGGFLKKGLYVDAGGKKNSQFLNTMIAASGARNADGTPVMNFGDAGVPTGMMPEIMTGTV